MPPSRLPSRLYFLTSYRALKPFNQWLENLGGLRSWHWGSLSNKSFAVILRCSFVMAILFANIRCCHSKRAASRSGHLDSRRFLESGRRGWTWLSRCLNLSDRLTDIVDWVRTLPYLSLKNSTIWGVVHLPFSRINACPRIRRSFRCASVMKRRLFFGPEEAWSKGSGDALSDSSEDVDDEDDDEAIEGG